MRDATDYADIAPPLPLILAAGTVLLVASAAITAARRVLSCLAPDEDVGPYVCPGCFAVASSCAPWCPDLAAELAEMDREHEDPDPDDYDWCDDPEDIPF